MDLMVVGQFGDASSISAVGTGSTFMQMVTFVITSLAMGSTVIIGQHIGEKKPKEAGDAVGTTIVLFAVIGIIMTILLEIFAGSLMSLLQVPEASYDKAVTYVRICSGGILIIIAYNVISGVLRGVGNANLPFIFVGIACVVNIIGDLLFVAVFHLDAAGAALATVLAQLVSVICSLFVLRRQSLPVSFSLQQCRIYGNELKKILNIGVPIALQEAMVQISFLVINTIVNHMGLMPSAGYGVAQKIVSFIMLVPSSVMQTVSAFVAQNIGAGKPERAKKGYFTAIITGCTVGIFIFIAGFFGGGLLSSFFTSDPDVIAQSALYLKGFSAECILTCILFSSIGYFNGCGNSILYPYPCVDSDVKTAQHLSDAGGICHTDHYNLWNHFLCGMLPDDETKKQNLIKKFPRGFFHSPRGNFFILSSDQYLLSLKSKSIFFDLFPGNSSLK